MNISQAHRMPQFFCC